MKREKKSFEWDISKTQIRRIMRRTTNLHLSEKAIYEIQRTVVETIVGITKEAEKIALERGEKTILQHQIEPATQRYQNRVFGKVIENVIPVLESSIESIRHLVSLLQPGYAEKEVKYEKGKPINSPAE